MTSRGEALQRDPDASVLIEPRRREISIEAFEHIVKVALESENYVVTSNLKFYVRRRTRKTAYEEYQSHGYEIDLVGAKEGSLVLASVKSFFGSAGVSRQGFRSIADPAKKGDFGGYRLFNEADIQEGVIREAAQRFGYLPEHVQLRLYVGKFKASDEAMIREHLGQMTAGGHPVQVIGLAEIVDRIVALTESRTYVNDPVVMTLKVLDAAGRLNRE